MGKNLTQDRLSHATLTARRRVPPGLATLTCLARAWWEGGKLVAPKYFKFRISNVLLGAHAACNTAATRHENVGVFNGFQYDARMYNPMLSKIMLLAGIECHSNRILL
jgi:hypothetical protein